MGNVRFDLKKVRFDLRQFDSIRRRTRSNFPGSELKTAEKSPQTQLRPDFTLKCVRLELRQDPKTLNKMKSAQGELGKLYRCQHDICEKKKENNETMKKNLPFLVLAIVRDIELAKKFDSLSKKFESNRFDSISSIRSNPALHPTPSPRANDTDATNVARP